MIGRSVRAWAASYRSTLKPLELEEPLDLVIYRPLAFAFVRAVRHLPVTPNQVSLASLAAGVIAGVCFWQGTPAGNLMGAACYFLCNVLDCADGQLARLRRAKSIAGYVLDGTIDTLSAIAVFVGIAHAPPPIYAGTPWWILLVAAAGLTMVWSSMRADRKRQEWMAMVYGHRVDSDGELASFVRDATTCAIPWERRMLRVLLAFYRGYRRLCEVVIRRSPEVSATVDPAWRRAHLPILRAAVITGPTAHVSGIILAAAFNRIEIYLVGAIAVGLVSAVAHQAAERIAQRRLSITVSHAG